MSQTPNNRIDVVGEIKTIKQMRESVESWQNQRKEQYSNNFGWAGRDLRSQEDLLKTVLDLEQDVSALFRMLNTTLLLLEPTPKPKSTEKTK